MEMIMSKPIFVAALLLALTGSVALAGAPVKPEENSLSGKAMRDQPGNNSAGTTANPTGKPEEHSASGKAMRDQPGNNSGGSTASPTAQPGDNSLSGKAMKDLPGNK
jgi:hypothetical protein